MEAVFGEDVYLSAEQGLEVHEEAAEIEEAASFFQLHEEIDVALGIGRTLGDGAEDPHVRGAVLGGQPQDIVPRVGRGGRG